MGGSFLMAHFAAKEMLKNNWGRIINVTTSFDTMLAGGLSAYGASKSALEASTASWAKDLADTGVTVNILVPGGPADTAFFPAGRAEAAGADRSAGDGLAGGVACVAGIGRHDADIAFVARDWDEKSSVRSGCGEGARARGMAYTRRRRAIDARRGDLRGRLGMRGLACAALLLAGIGPLAAQDYPNRPITIMGTTPPGTSVDLTTRFFGERVKAKTGQPWVVENKPGAQGSIAAKAAASAKPDGYTAFLCTSGALVREPVSAEVAQLRSATRTSSLSRGCSSSTLR